MINYNEVDLPQTQICRHDDSFFLNSQNHRRKGMESNRNSLDKSDTKVFDQMFSLAHMYNSGASYAALTVRLTI